MAEKLVCPICGEPTRVYMGNARKDRLCGKHADELKAGKLVLDEKGNFVSTEKEESNQNELTCIICGQISNGYHFCKDCYKKYKDKSVDLRIKNCTETTILDEYGNRKYTCEDGRKVRSLQEKVISDFLFNNKIRAVYEKEVYYTENDEDKVLHPDFYLPDYDIYIEHYGMTGKKYEQMKEYKERIYKENNLKLVVTCPEDLSNIAAKLKPILKIN